MRRISERILKEWHFYQPYLLVIGALLVAGIYVSVYTDSGSPGRFPEILRNGLMVVTWPLVGVLAFGNECSYGTMPMLLTQGMPRRRIWFEKMFVLSGVMALLILLFRVHFWTSGQDYDRDFSLLFWAGPFYAFTTGPLFALLFRNILAAMLFGLLTPFTIMLATALLLPADFWYPQRVHVLVQLVYGLAAFPAGYWIFMRYQDYDRWSRSLNISWRWLAPLSTAVRRVPLSSTMSGVTRSLIYKELHLQQLTFLSAVILTMMFIGLVLFRSKMHLIYLSYYYALAWFICILVSILSGAFGYAEEKHLGISQWHFALPVSLNRQWFTKVLCIHAVSLLLAGLLPLLLYYLIPSWGGEDDETMAQPWFILGLKMLLFSLAITTMSLLASALTRNTGQAALLATLLLVLSLVATANQGAVYAHPDKIHLVAALSFLLCWAGVEASHYGLFARRMNLWSDSPWWSTGCTLLGLLLSFAMLAWLNLTFRFMA